MKRVRHALLVAGLAGSVLATASASPAPAAPATPAAPMAVGVGAREFSLSLYRTKVKPGAIRFNVTNFGEDGHDLAVVDPRGKVVARVAEMHGGGGRGQVEVTLRQPGTYTLLCTVADHAKRGMRVKLHVRR